jgi:hypothetical protein
MWRITIAYIIILVLEYLYYTFYLSNWKTRLGNSIGVQTIDFNLKNKDALKVKMINLLNERVQLLNKMDYTTWVEYNNKNVLLDFQGKKYYLYIYEKADDLNNASSISNFILRASYQKELINLSYEDEARQINQRYLVFNQFPVNLSLINEMYYMDPTIDGCNLIEYYWEDPMNKRAIQKLAYFKGFHKKNPTRENGNDTIDGVIGIGYEVDDLDYNYSDINLNYVGIPFFLLLSFGIYLLSVSLYFANDSKFSFRPISVLVILNIFLVYQLSSIGTITDVQLEQTRMTEITTSTLGVSFLIAVNIFIIQTIRNKKGYNYQTLYNETAFLFSASLIFLVLSMFKESNFTEVNGLRGKRIQNQILFNLAVIMNLSIFLNYLLLTSNRPSIFNIHPFYSLTKSK